jgi:hypothetical protein
MNKSSGPVLLGLLNRAVLLALLFCLLCLLLYGLGLWRGFTSPNLLIILRLAVYGGIFLTALSAYRFVAGLWFCLRRRRPLLLLISLGFLALGALGAAVAAAGTFIAALAGGSALK